ncbi:hypothetical protein F4803DRAFT_532951 [Xylaria telfairii]|nr:hypothetical protein F4803DRAFT_532951 [Xylaria telfairii]
MMVFQLNPHVIAASLMIILTTTVPSEFYTRFEVISSKCYHFLRASRSGAQCKIRFTPPLRGMTATVQNWLRREGTSQSPYILPPNDLHVS